MYNDVVDDKIDFVNKIGKLYDNAIKTKKKENFKDDILKLINNREVRDLKKKNTKKDIKKKDTEKHNNKKDTKKVIKRKDNTKPDTKPDTNVDTRASIKDKQKSINNRYKSLSETRKTIRNNIDLIYRALRKLPNKSQSKLVELVRLDTILNNSINVIWRELRDRDKKSIKKIDINKIKNVDSFMYQLKGIINHKVLLLKTSVMVKLNLIISDIKNKSNTGVYNYNDKDKLVMRDNDLDKYMKHLKRDLGSIKQNLKMISTYQTDSNETLKGFIK